MAPTIAFLTDFGTADAYVGVVEATIARIAPATRVIHLTHGVPPQDLRNGSWQLWAAAPYLPDGAIVLAVVDPGVGSARRAIVVETERLTFVAPDNGLLEAALAEAPPVAVHALESPRHRLSSVSSTFHGRDVFGPAAAHLSLGVAPRDFGPAIVPSELSRLGVATTDGEHGEVWTSDRFGNVITTLRDGGDRAKALTIAGRTVPVVDHYAAVAPGELLGLVGSSGLYEVSVRDGSAAAALGLERVASYAVSRVTS